MTWVLTLLGIMALIVLHELGHFAVAKAVGMRVERFSLFFPPRLFGVKRGETDYSVGAIPAGGYVKITGMSWEELKDTDLRVAVRARSTSCLARSTTWNSKSYLAVACLIARSDA